jgi:3-deoxy-manno-octulosonate cytidylyltransferase (CMP-KDO synthetase)
MKVAILIPARFASTRFPGKPLALIKNRPMIHWILDKASQVSPFTYVVTDHDEIEKSVQQLGKKVLRVNDAVETGSERIQLAYDRYLKNENFDLIVNLQGDEPLVVVDDLKRLCANHLASTDDIFTMVKKEFSPESFANPNVVKVFFSEATNRCHFFSRQSIPYFRNSNLNQDGFYQHIGVYSYRPNALEKFAQLPPSIYEKIESLEQLRAIENAMKIGAIITQANYIGVDVESDIAKVESHLY